MDMRLMSWGFVNAPLLGFALGLPISCWVLFRDWRRFEIWFLWSYNRRDLFALPRPLVLLVAVAGLVFRFL